MGRNCAYSYSLDASSCKRGQISYSFNSCVDEILTTILFLNKHRHCEVQLVMKMYEKLHLNFYLHIY